MFRRLALIVIAVAWTQNGQARVLQDLATLAHDLVRFAKPVADCDAACMMIAKKAGTGVVTNAVRVRGRLAADAFRAYLAEVSPAVATSPAIKTIAVKKGNAAFTKYEGQLQYVLPLFEKIDGLVEAVSKLPRTHFANDLARQGQVPVEGAAELGRSLIHQVGEQLITSPANEKNFLALFALGRILDGGDGEISDYARHLIAFRIAMSEVGHVETLGTAEYLRTLFAIRDPSPNGLLARMATRVQTACAATDATAITQAFDGLLVDNQHLVTFKNKVAELKLSLADFGISEAETSQALRAFRELAEVVTKGGLVADDQMLIIMEKNYLGLDGWRDTIRTIVHRNPDLADSPEFLRLMQFDDFRLFATGTLLR